MSPIWISLMEIIHDKCRVNCLSTVPRSAEKFYRFSTRELENELAAGGKFSFRLRPEKGKKSLIFLLLLNREISPYLKG